MRTLIALFLLVFAVACQRAPREPDVIKTYQLKGVIVSVDAAHKSAVIKHETIEGFMEAMTMEFPVRDPEGFAKLQPGVKIRARVQQRPRDFDYWIDQIVVE